MTNANVPFSLPSMSAADIDQAAGAAMLILAAQSALLPALPAIGRMHFAHLRHVLAVPLARTGLIAGTAVTIGQFAASTFVTPFLVNRVHLDSGTATAVLLCYGLAGIAGTLLGSRLVARNPVTTFVGAAAAIGIVLAILPILDHAPAAIAILFASWGILWGLVPLALQTLMLTAVPDAPEAASAMFITTSQLAIAAGAALGGILLDTAGLSPVFIAAAAVTLTASVFAALARRGV
jgi:predicted MFS family arabinose efflux permease